MANFLSWSYSRLRTFLNCPKEMYHINVAPRGHPDRIPYEQSPYAREGDLVDQAITARLAHKVPLPPQVAHLEPVCDLIATTPGTVLTQLDLALDQSFQPCGSKDWDRCWLRVKIDVAVFRGPWAALIDNKNGRVDIDEKQLKLYAATAFRHFPELEVADTAYAWLKHGLTTPRRYHRREEADLWQTFLPDVQRMQIAYQTNHWPATPENKIGGASVCTWCSVNKAGKCPVAKVKYGERLRTS